MKTKLERFHEGIGLAIEANKALAKAIQESVSLTPSGERMVQIPREGAEEIVSYLLHLNVMFDTLYEGEAKADPLSQKVS